jgi:hypothetical protein
MMRVHFAAALLLAVLVVAARAGEAAQSAAPDLPFAFDGPLPPVAPEVITRDEAGRATVRAVRLPSPRAYGDAFEFLPQPFRIAPGVTLPVGGYDFASVRTLFNSGQQRRISGNVSAEYGTFYDGHKTTIGISRGRLNLSSQLSVEPTFSVNWVDLVEGSFTTWPARA